MEKKKFYNFITLTKVGEVIVATLEGSTTQQAIEMRNVTVKDENKSVAQFTLKVDGNLQKRFDYASKSGVEGKTYKDFDFVRVVGWQDVAERMQVIHEPHRKMLLTGILSQKSYKGKDGEVKYLELAVQDKFNFKGIGAKTTTNANVEPNVGDYSSQIEPEDDGDIPF